MGNEEIRSNIVSGGRVFEHVRRSRSVVPNCGCWTVGRTNRQLGNVFGVDQMRYDMGRGWMRVVG